MPIQKRFFDSETFMTQETICELTRSLAMSVGLDGPYTIDGASADAVSCFMIMDGDIRMPATFAPCRNPVDAMLVAAALKMEIKYKDDSVVVQNRRGVHREFLRSNSMADPLKALCRAVMIVASLTLEIPYNAK